MSKQILIIGLGQFGMGLLRSLSESDSEIIAVDRDSAQVEKASSWASQVFTVDGTDEQSIRQLQPDKRDVCICATGDESKEVGIICTALLKQMGAKRIIARANDDLNARILKLVGADEVVNPEWDFGARYAAHILSENVLGEMVIGSGIIISDILAPKHFYEKSFMELNLQSEYGITVVAVKQKKNGKVTNVNVEYKIKEGDVLICAAKRGSLEKIVKKEEWDD